MKKQFLDELYLLRFGIVKDIEGLEWINRQDRLAPCSKCKSECDENMAELRTRRSQLESTDKIILSYLNHHSLNII